MEKIYQINLKGDYIDDLHNIFEIRKASSPLPVHNDQYYVKIYDADTNRLGSYAKELFYFGVFDSDDHMLGIFNIKKLSMATIIYFYIEDKKFQQAFIEYIRSIKEEMKLIGFTILDSHGSGEEKINLEIANEPYLPKKEGISKNSVENTSNSFTNDISDSTSEEISKQANKPWEQIDESENLKEMVRLIHDGLSATEIAENLAYSIKTIYNWSSKLRQKYGNKKVPYFQKWRKIED